MAPRFSLGVRAAIALAAALLTLPVPVHAVRVMPAGAGSVTLVGAGDIAVCGSDNDSATATLVSSVLAEQASNVAFSAGDNVYPDGSSGWPAESFTPSASKNTFTVALPGSGSR